MVSWSHCQFCYIFYQKYEIMFQDGTSIGEGGGASPQVPLHNLQGVS